MVAAAEEQEQSSAPAGPDGHSQSRHGHLN
jgi:hypothetical protein